MNDERPLSWLERARRVREGEAGLADHPADVSYAELEDFVATILRRSFDAVVLCTKLGEYLEVSDSFCALTGYSRAELLGQTSITLGMVDPNGIRSVVALEVLDKQEGVYDNIVIRKDGTPRVVEFSHQYLDSGYTLVIVRDVTERRLREQELDRLSHEDPLTGVLNRRGFTRRAESLLTEARSTATSMHLVVADVDQLKALNDELGHEFGDHTLIAVATALRSAYGPEAVVGRLGGDEFAVAVSGRSDDDNDDALIRLRRTLSRATIGPIGVVRAVSLSVGVAESDDVVTIDHLIAAADASQYVEKRAGRASFPPTRRAEREGRDQALRAQPHPH